MRNIDVTWLTSQAPMSWLKAGAEENMEAVDVTWPTSQAPMSWLKAGAK